MQFNTPVCEERRLSDSTLEDTLEENFKTFRAYIESCVKVSDLIVFCGNLFSSEQIKTYRHKCRQGSVQVLPEIFDVIESMKDKPDRYTQLLHGFLEAGYPKIGQILQGRLIPKNDKHRQRVKAATPHIYNMLNVTDAVPHLFSKGVINEHDKAEILAYEVMRSRSYAALELILILPNRSRNWYTLFIEALVESSQVQLANIIDEDLAKEKRGRLRNRSLDELSLASVSSLDAEVSVRLQSGLTFDDKNQYGRRRHYSRTIKPFDFRKVSELISEEQKPETAAELSLSSIEPEGDEYEDARNGNRSENVTANKDEVNNDFRNPKEEFYGTLTKHIITCKNILEILSKEQTNEVKQSAIETSRIANIKQVCSTIANLDMGLKLLEKELIFKQMSLKSPSSSRKLDLCGPHSSPIDMLQQSLSSMFDVAARPWITGSIFFSDTDLVLCDYNNRNLLFYNEFTYINTLHLSERPWDISVMSGKELIVSIPFQCKLQFISFVAEPKESYSFNVNKRCWGVTGKNGDVYVSCYNFPHGYANGEIKVFTKSGEEKHRIGFSQYENFKLQRPMYIALNAYGNELYVSDYDTSVITCVSLDTMESRVFQDINMKNPSIIEVDNNNRVYVYSSASHNVYCIKPDGAIEIDTHFNRKMYNTWVLSVILHCQQNKIPF